MILVILGIAVGRMMMIEWLLDFFDWKRLEAASEKILGHEKFVRWFLVGQFRVSV